MTAVSHPRQAPRRRSLPRNCSWSESVRFGLAHWPSYPPRRNLLLGGYQDPL